MSAGYLFSLVSLPSFLVVNTVALPSLGLILPPCPPFSFFRMVVLSCTLLLSNPSR